MSLYQNKNSEIHKITTTLGVTLYCNLKKKKNNRANKKFFQPFLRYFENRKKKKIFFLMLDYNISSYLIDLNSNVIRVNLNGVENVNLLK